MSESIISLVLQIIGQYSGAIASFTMAIIVFYFNRRLLKLYIKDREKPKIAELMRFCIVPLKEWLEYQLGKAEFEELNWEELFGRAWITHILNPTLLYIEFNTLLEKSEKKNEWDKNINQYNKLRKEFSQNVNDLGKKLKELLDNDQSLRDRYEKSIRYVADIGYSAGFDTFKKKLIDEFFTCHRAKMYGNSPSGAWYYLGDQVFAEFEDRLRSILQTIDSILEMKDALLKSLIDLLEDICERLRKDYNLTPSEQKSAIDLRTVVAHVF
jgi:hypothetical protein